MKKWFRQRFRHKNLQAAQKVMVIPRAQHILSRTQMSRNVLKVLQGLQEARFDAYLVGGSVRDILLSRQPKDFDVVTNALPEQIHKVFRNSRIIGRRFRLVHVFYHGDIIEVSTFRANIGIPAHINKHKLGLRPDNSYGTIEEDAWRRDFTVNALYYSIKDLSVLDYTGGIADLKQGIIRMIGDPEQRFHEDPVRLLRAIRLSAKLKFTLNEDISQCLHALSFLLTHVPSARLFDEVLKLFFEGNATLSYKKLLEVGYFSVLFPGTAKILTERGANHHQKLLDIAMRITDQRFADSASLNPAYLFAVILWPLMVTLVEDGLKNKRPLFVALRRGVENAIKMQQQTIKLPRRLQEMMRAIWFLQYQLENRRGSRVFKILSNRYFRAAYDFLALRAASGERLESLVDWWGKVQNVEFEQQEKILAQLSIDAS